METIFGTRIDELLRVGVLLNDIGVSNWALTQKQAIDVLQQFIVYRIPVLGGDVYEFNDNEINPCYDNWYCDELIGENLDSYLERSIQKAKNYVESYQSKNIQSILFVLIPQIKGSVQNG